jgi:hypothetical protein
MNIHWAILTNSIVIHFDGQTKNISKDNADLYDKVLRAIKEKRTSDIPSILDVIGNISVKSNKAIEIRDGYVYIDGDVVENSIATRIIQYNTAQIPFDGLVEFWRNLKQNPSYRARQRLFLFLENAGHPFTDDGHFIAYKAVTKDFKDIRTKTFDNSIGKLVQMDRCLVNDDPDIACAEGLHVAAFKYLTDSGYYTRTNENGYIYICVKVNPKNVVCIPKDEQNMKIRLCEYEVLSLSDAPLTEVHYSTPTDSSENEEDSGEESDMSSSTDVSSSSSSESSVESSSSESEEVVPTPPELPKAPVTEENKESGTDNSHPPGFVMSEDVSSESESSSSEEW